MYITLNGTDVSKLVKDNGITRGSILRGAKTRITLGGKKYQSSIRKDAYNIRFEPMSETDLKTLVGILNQDYVTMVYRDPVKGQFSKTFISSVSSTDLVMEEDNGMSYWSGLEVDLEEQ